MKTHRETASTSRPYAFLVTTTGWAGSIGKNLGSAGYSYYFAYEALRPALERLGTCELVERPESRLAFLAERAKADGYEPIHLAVNPPNEVYLTPAVRTVIYPFWEFPGIPDRDFGTDTRQNWTRALRKSDAVAAPCSFTRDALRRSCPDVNMSVVPVPLRPEFFELPPWDPNKVWTVRLRHVVWTGEPRAMPAGPIVRPTGRNRAALDKLARYIGEPNVARICRIKQAIVPDPGQSLGSKMYENLRYVYTKSIRRWMSDDAVRLITKAKAKVLRTMRIPEKVTVLPGLPEGELTLTGTVYTTIFNIGDERKNPVEILSAFLLAFRDRADVTLVVKLVTNRLREHHELVLLRRHYESLGLSHKCRIVVITEYLSDEQMAKLFEATTYYVNHSFGEGACLPLQQGLAGGRPALAPGHSAMLDYLDDSVAFVTRSFPEPIHWPHDPEKRIETVRFRPLWADLHDHFVESERILRKDRPRYEAMSATARERMRAYASVEGSLRALETLLAGLPTRAVGALDWAG